MQTQFKDEIIDYRWKVLGSRPNGNHHTIYKLENIQNGMQVEISDNSFRSIRRGETSVSKIISKRIKNIFTLY